MLARTLLPRGQNLGAQKKGGPEEVQSLEGVEDCGLARHQTHAVVHALEEEHLLVPHELVVDQMFVDVHGLEERQILADVLVQAGDYVPVASHSLVEDHDLEVDHDPAVDHGPEVDYGPEVDHFLVVDQILVEVDAHTLEEGVAVHILEVGVGVDVVHIPGVVGVVHIPGVVGAFHILGAAVAAHTLEEAKDLDHALGVDTSHDHSTQ